LLCVSILCAYSFIFFFQAEDGIRDATVTGVQTCALPIFDRGPAGGHAELRDVEVGVAGEVAADGLAGDVGRAVLALGRGQIANRSEERRVGKECRCRWGTYQRKRKKI